MRIHNERGAALVIVLGMIMLIMIFGSMLAAQMSNTQQQLKITEEVIDARNIAKMALDRAAFEVEKAFDVYQNDIFNANLKSKESDRNAAKVNAWALFEQTVTNIPGRFNGEIQLDPNHFYSILECKIIDKDVTVGGVTKTQKSVKIEVSSRAYQKTLNDSNSIPINLKDQ